MPSQQAFLVLIKKKRNYIVPKFWAIVDNLFIKNQKLKNIRKNSYDTIDKHINQFLNESDESSDLLAESIANSDLFFNKKNPYNVYNKDSIEQMN